MKKFFTAIAMIAASGMSLLAAVNYAPHVRILGAPLQFVIGLIMIFVIPFRFPF